MTKPRIPKPPKMNGDERAYAEMLELRKRAGDILDWKFNGIRFDLGGGAWYKPDFYVVRHDRFEIVEVKGFKREAAVVRFKAAAALFPHYHWTMIRRRGPQWERLYEL